MNAILRGIVLSVILAAPVHAEQPWEKFREYPGPYHLGDEHIGSWSPLIGSCVSIEFPNVRTGGRIGVTYEPYGLENAYIEFSSGDRFALPPQRVLSGRRPNYWGELTNQTFSASQFLNGVTARICAAFLEPGDLDDFMLRNVATWGQQPVPAVAVPQASVVQDEAEINLCVPQSTLTSHTLKPPMLGRRNDISVSYCYGVQQWRTEVLGQNLAELDNEKPVFQALMGYDQICGYYLLDTAEDTWSMGYMQMVTSVNHPSFNLWFPALDRECSKLFSRASQWLETTIGQ